MIEEYGTGISRSQDIISPEPTIKGPDLQHWSVVRQIDVATQK